MLEMVMGEDFRETEVLEMILREGGELVGSAVSTGGGDIWEVADCGCERAEDTESEDEEDQKAEAMGPDVDGVVVEGEEGGAEAGAQRGEMRAVRAYEIVVVAHPGRELAERE